MVNQGEARRTLVSSGEIDTYFSDEALEGIPALPDRSREGATVHAGKGSIQFDAFFSHACCRKGSLLKRTHDREGHLEITLTILLAGDICRCECHSDLHGTLQLPPGRYRFRIQKESEGGEAQPLYSGIVDVP